MPKYKVSILVNESFEGEWNSVNDVLDFADALIDNDMVEFQVVVECEGGVEE